MSKVALVGAVLLVMLSAVGELHAANIYNRGGNTGQRYQGNYGNNYNNNNNWGYTYGGNNDNNNLQQQQQQQHTGSNNYYNSEYNNLLQQQYEGYYDGGGLASRADYATQESSYAPAATYNTGTVAVDNPDSSPALSALALLGFLYFLNLIQDVLQNNNGRRRRSVGKNGGFDEDQEEDDLYYSTSYLGDDLIFQGLEGDQLEGPEGDFVSGQEEEEEEEEDEGEVLKVKEEEGEEEEEEEEEEGEEAGEDKEDVKVEEEEEKSEENEVKSEPRSQSSPRANSFLEDFFISLPQLLGLTSKPKVDRDDRIGKKPMDVGGFFTSRLKMISSIMSFLQDPRPTRVRRAVQDSVGSEEPGTEGWISWITPHLESFLPYVQGILEDYLFPEERSALPRGNVSSGNRERRHTHYMNAWYDHLNGRNVEISSGVNGWAAKMTSFLGGGDELQDAARKDAAPTLLELTRGLSGNQPHCLQRALCRMNTHAHKFSFMPRLAMQLLSNSLVESNSLEGSRAKAIQAGRQGEDCTEIFPECKT